MADYGGSYNASQRRTLKSRVEADPLPPQPTAGYRRKMDLNVTGYPHPLNAHLLPERARQETEFGELPKRQHLNHNNEGTYDGSKERSILPMQTTKQLAAQMTQLGTDMHNNPDTLTYQNTTRGYRAKNYNTAFDERSVYRLDYCQDDIPPLPKQRFTDHLENYRDGWTEEEVENINAAMRKPYLTQPESSLRDARGRTTYRYNYNNANGLASYGMSNAVSTKDDPTQYRLLSHKTDLRELGTTFGYSGYQGEEDPRRTVYYNEEIADLRNPHSVLEKTYSPRKNFEDKRRGVQDGYGATMGSATVNHNNTMGSTTTFANISNYVNRTYREDSMNGSTSRQSNSRARQELNEMRTLRRASLERSLAARDSYRRRQSAEQIADEAGSPLVLPGVKGTGGRRAPTSNKEEYIYLPKDHFVHQTIYDY